MQPCKHHRMRPRLPAPQHPRAAPRDLLAALRREIGESAAAACCAELLDGADPVDYADVLPYLGGNLDWPDHWARVWGARGLLYVWTESAGTVVVAGLADPAWRVVENCLKVSTQRELSDAGPAAVGLTGHHRARVRAQAVRTLAAVGDTEHVVAVAALADDPEPTVRAATDRAMTRLIERLDLPR
jgi:hypothetical protein